MEYLDKAIAFINENAMSSVMLISMLLEFGLRLTTSKKPLSIMWVCRDLITKCSKLFEALASLMDKVLPQRVVEDKPEE